MTFDGKMCAVEKEILSGGYKIAFTTPELPELEGLTKDKLLEVKVKVKRHRRSLDANAYAWVLINQIAKVLGSSDQEVYLNAIKNYGQIAFPMRVPHGTEVAPDNGGKDAMKLYFFFYEYNGKDDCYLVYRGSSTYDTKEMSDFIDGVVQDAKELGIDTVPRSELEKIKEKWHL